MNIYILIVTFLLPIALRAQIIDEKTPTCSNKGTSFVVVNSTISPSSSAIDVVKEIKTILQIGNNKFITDSKGNYEVTYAYNQQFGFADRIANKWDRLRSISGADDKTVSKFLFSPKAQLNLAPDVSAEMLRYHVENDVDWERQGLSPNEVVVSKVALLMKGLLLDGKKVIAVTDGNGGSVFARARDEIITIGGDPDVEANAYADYLGAIYFRPFGSVMGGEREKTIAIKEDQYYLKAKEVLSGVGATHTINLPEAGQEVGISANLNLANDYLNFQLQAIDLGGTFARTSTANWFVSYANHIASKMANCGCLVNGVPQPVRRHFNYELLYSEQENKYFWTAFPGGFVEDNDLNPSDVSPYAFIDPQSYICGSSKVSAFVNVVNSEIKDSSLTHPLALLNSGEPNYEYIYSQLFGSHKGLFSNVINSKIIDSNSIIGNFDITDSTLTSVDYDSASGFSSSEILSYYVDIIDGVDSRGMNSIPRLTISSNSKVKLASLKGNIQILQDAIVERVKMDNRSRFEDSFYRHQRTTSDGLARIAVISSSVTGSELNQETTSAYYYKGSTVISGGSKVESTIINNSQITKSNISGGQQSLRLKGVETSGKIVAASGSSIQIASTTLNGGTSSAPLVLSGSIDVNYDSDSRTPGHISFNASTGDETLDTVTINGLYMRGGSIGSFNQVGERTKPTTIEGAKIINSGLSIRGSIGNISITNSGTVMISDNDKWGSGIKITNSEVAGNPILGDGTTITNSVVVSSKIEGSSNLIEESSYLYGAQVLASGATITNGSIIDGGAIVEDGASRIDHSKLTGQIKVDKSKMDNLCTVDNYDQEPTRENSLGETEYNACFNEEKTLTWPWFKL